MFAKDKGGNASYDTLISAKTEIKGDIHFSGGVHVEGVVTGNLIGKPDSNAIVRISDKGRVDGKVSAPNIIINGEVNGDVHALKYIELAKKAQITGDLYYHMMEMVLGAQVNGKLNHSAEKANIETDIAIQTETQDDENLDG